MWATQLVTASVNWPATEPESRSATGSGNASETSGLILKMSRREVLGGCPRAGRGAGASFEDVLALHVGWMLRVGHSVGVRIEGVGWVGAGVLQDAQHPAPTHPHNHLRRHDRHTGVHQYPSASTSSKPTPILRLTRGRQLIPLRRHILKTNSDAATATRASA